MAQEVKDVAAETAETTASNEKAMKRGTVLQALKAIAVLVVICLVCGALLALCNDIFYISPEERARREEAKINAALKEVYPNLENPETIKINKNFETYGAYGSVSKVVKSADGAYIIAAKGNGGYGGVPITVLIAIDPSAKIVAWKVSDAGQETWMNLVEPYTEWYVGEQISTDLPVLSAGASYSSLALNNAIKTASYYAMNVLNLGSNPQKDAEDAIAALLADTDYADYTFAVNSDLKYRAALSDENNAMSYFFVGSKEGASETLDAYVYNVETEAKVVILKGNLGYTARHEQDAVIAKSEDIADELVTKVQDLNYYEFKIHTYLEDFRLAQYIAITDGWDTKDARINSVFVGEDGTYVVNATGKGGFASGTVTVNVVIKDGVITELNVESHESQSYLSDHILNIWDTFKMLFVGNSIDIKFDTTPPVDEGSTPGHTGATYSENAIIRAVNYACEYVKSLTEQGGTN